MKNINVIFDEGLSTLYTKLKRKQFKINKISKEEFNIEIKDSEEYAIFIEILNRYLIKNHFINATKSIMKKKGYNNEFIEYMLEVDTIKNIDIVSYFKVSTEILLLEYFKTLDVINLKSFMNLNMKGFKNEAKLIIEMLEDYMANSTVDTEDGENIEAYIQDMSTALTNLIQTNELNPANFSEITVNLFEDDSVEVIGKNGVSYTIDSVGEQMGMEIQEIMGDDSTILETSILFISLIISVMKTSRVIVPKGSKEFQNILNVYLQSMKLVVDIVEKK